MSRCRLLCMARFVWKIRIFVYLDNLRDIATFFHPKELRKNNNLDIYNSKFFFFAFCENEKIFHFPNAQALYWEKLLLTWCDAEKMKTWKTFAMCIMWLHIEVSFHNYCSKKFSYAISSTVVFRLFFVALICVFQFENFLCWFW